MLERKHVAGIAVAMVLFGMFGLFAGNVAAALAGVGFDEPLAAYATGPTPLEASSVTEPFGVSPAVLGLPPDARVVLPAFPATVRVLGVEVLSFEHVQSGWGFFAGGAVLGFVVGSYYAVTIAWEQRRSAERADDRTAE